MPIRHDGVALVDNASKPPLLHEDVTEHQVAMEESRARLVRSSDVVADLGCIKCDGSTDLLAASKGFGGHQVYGAATSAVGASARMRRTCRPRSVAIADLFSVESAAASQVAPGIRVVAKYGQDVVGSSNSCPWDSSLAARTPGLSAMQRIAARSPAYARRQKSKCPNSLITTSPAISVAKVAPRPGSTSTHHGKVAHALDDAEGAEREDYPARHAPELPVVELLKQLRADPGPQHGEDDCGADKPGGHAGGRKLVEDGGGHPCVVADLDDVAPRSA